MHTVVYRGMWSNCASYIYRDPQFQSPGRDHVYLECACGNVKRFSSSVGGGHKAVVIDGLHWQTLMPAQCYRQQFHYYFHTWHPSYSTKLLAIASIQLVSCSYGAFKYGTKQEQHYMPRSHAV